jgi:hypothetical protein
VLSALSIVVVRLMARMWHTFLFSLFIFEVFFYIGLINSIVLTYQFLDKRYFLKTPRLQRRLLIAVCSVVMTTIPAIAVVTVVVGLFIIK